MLGYIFFIKDFYFNENEYKNGLRKKNQKYQDMM
jgi:hypothetical protein